jgi:predicted DNA-binding mobile mystery protein A
MKISRKQLINQRKILERKIEDWLPLRKDRSPPSGWIKAIRGALGINSRQLATHLGVAQSAIHQFEESEKHHTISLETLEKVAHAMRCQVVYAIIPQEPFSTLEQVLDDQALRAAKLLVSKVDHTMKLEQQGITQNRLDEQVQEIAKQLKETLDSSLWAQEKK